MKPLTRRLGALTLFAGILFAAPAARVGNRDISSERYIEDVRLLASEPMKGRGTRTPELEKAAKSIAHQFRSSGLHAVDGKSYLQAFSVTVNSHLGPVNHFEYS